MYAGQSRNTVQINASVYDLAEYTAGNTTITDSIGMTYAILQKYQRPMCAISGGSDSDIVIDLCSRLDTERKTRYVWYNTGLEYQATKEHLAYLEQRYDVHIERINAVKSIPFCCMEYGRPFLSKIVSKYLEKLQRSGFQWEDEPYEVLSKRYPDNYAVAWWCNRREAEVWNIEHYRYLKGFLVSNPPRFAISDKCCYYAKKKTAGKCVRDSNADVTIMGVRKAEGGARSVSIKSCFTEERGLFRPIFWYSDQDKTEYDRLFDIQHSDCYRVWGFKRTGCTGCPFGRNVFGELEAAKRYEPGLYKAACRVFGDSYDYTRQYREYVRQHKSGDKTLNLFEEIDDDEY